MFCQNCGAQLGESNFCPNCGAQVNGAQGTNQNSTQQYSYQTYTQNTQYPTKSVGPVSAFISMFKNFANFRGRSRRSEYWMAYLANNLLMFIVSIVFAAVCMDEFESIARTIDYKIAFDLPISFSDFGAIGVFFVLVLVYGLILIIPSLSLLVRRLHDTGKSGWFILLSLVPMVGSIVIFVFTVLDSTPGPNKYGPNPKGIN